MIFNFFKRQSVHGKHQAFFTFLFSYLNNILWIRRYMKTNVLHDFFVFGDDIARILGLNTWNLPLAAISEPLFTLLSLLPSSLNIWVCDSKWACLWNPLRLKYSSFFWVRDSIFESDSRMKSLRETGLWQTPSKVAGD